jgi:hypothetical protein
LSYLFYLSRGNKRAAYSNIDIAGELAGLRLSDELQAIYDELGAKR